MSVPSISRLVIAGLGLLVLTGCAANGSDVSRGSLETSPTAPPLSAPEAVGRALASFSAYPPLHGRLTFHTYDGALSFDIWIREPEFRVELGVAGEEPIPWVSDGTTSNIREPHVHAAAFLLTDPREIFRSCDPDQPRLIGRDEVLGRSVTVVSCRSSSEEGSYWIDDETGLVLKGERKENAQSASWEFTALELNPGFPPGLFVVPTGGA